MERHKLPDFLEPQFSIERLWNVVTRPTACEYVLEQRSRADLQHAGHHDSRDPLISECWCDDEALNAADLTGGEHTDFRDGVAVAKRQERIPVRIIQMKHRRIRKLRLVPLFCRFF